MNGERLGPYAIDRELGSGGMGKVYAAVVEGRVPGLDVGTRVALKVVHSHLLETPGFFKRFLREAEIGQAVRHPNVVRTYDCDAAGGSHFLAMEYVEGQTLRGLLDELERVPEELCRHVGIEIAKGLAAIHEAGVIHRDMKPENVLITADHVVKVMDLGVARLADEALRLSQTGAFVGSLQYAAPESFQGGGADVDGRVDLHALGVLLYELACGANPYVADDVPQTIRKVLHDEPRKLGDANPQVSAFFEEVVHCLLAKDRDQRFASAEELASVLADGEDADWWHRRASVIRSVTKRPLRRVRIPRETAVYGREDELTKLRALYDRATSGEGCVVLIEGEAGIGKSRLVDELIGRLQRDGEDPNFLFGSYPPGGAATASGGFSTAYREQFGEAGCTDYLPTTPILAPAFDALLRGEPTPKDDEPLTKDSLQTCFVNATRALAAERPTVVLIDDLHFAPDEGRALYTSLAMAIPGHRVLLIGTTRPGVSEDWMSGLTRLDQTEQLALHRLGPKDLMALLRDTLNSERLATELAAQIATKSDGNPFFVFEIIRGLREGQFITQQADGTWVSTRVIDEIQIPSSVLDLVNARVADLDEEDKDLLEVASCWGYTFDPSLVAAAAGVPVVAALKRFGRIEKSHRLVRAAGREVSFDHHQVQEALYTGILEQLREHYHAALAEALAVRTNAAEQDPESLDGAVCVDLCDHYLKGARGESALRYLPAAQAHLLGGYLHAEMAVLTERALAVPGLVEDAARCEALLQLGIAVYRTGPYQRLAAVAAEAESIAISLGDDGLRAKALLYLGTASQLASRFDESEAAYRDGFELAIRVGLQNVAASAANGIGNVLSATGRPDEAEAEYRRSLTLASACGDTRQEAIAAGNIGRALHFQGRQTEAKEAAERLLQQSREIGDRESEARALSQLGLHHFDTGDIARARSYFEQDLALSREIGTRGDGVVAIGNLANVAQEEGRVAEALELFERSHALSSEVGSREVAALARVNIGIVLRELGNVADSDAHVRAGLAQCEAIGEARVTAHARAHLGSLLAQRGDLVAGLELLRSAHASAASVGLASLATVTLCELASHSPDDVAKAQAALVATEERMSASDRRAAHLHLWRATGDRAHLAEAKRLLDEAVAHVDAETRESMLTNLRVNREIMAACAAEGIA